MPINKRFNNQSNVTYNIPADYWESIKDSPLSFMKVAQYYVGQHWTNQVPRLNELNAYYRGDNKIHEMAMPNKNANQADNRIASSIAHYITDIRVGYQFGNPITYSYANFDNPDDTGTDIMNAVQDFNRSVDEAYHNKAIGKDLFNLGRGYELEYLPEDSKIPTLSRIDPTTCFVMWSTDIKPKELFAVRYYQVSIMDQPCYYVEVYTNDTIFYFKAGSSPQNDWTLQSQQPHYFKDVPITEFNLSDERMGIFESELDDIDAIDKAVSEMANTQEDFNNAMLLITGKIKNTTGQMETQTDANGNPLYVKPDGSITSESKDYKGNAYQPYRVKTVLNLKSNLLYLSPTVQTSGNGNTTVIPTQAEYLTKKGDLAGWQEYIGTLVGRIHKFTNTPNTSDKNFAENASGVAMSYKLWGIDQERAISETLFNRGVHRRLNMLFEYLNMVKDNNINFSDEESNPSANITINYTPNLPKNDEATMQTVQSLNATGKFSDETIHEMATTVTGITPGKEAERIKDEDDSDQQSRLDFANKVNGYGKGVNTDDNDSAGKGTDSEDTEA